MYGIFPYLASCSDSWMHVTLVRSYPATNEAHEYSCSLGTSKHVQDAEKYKLGHPRLFHYLNQSKTYELEGVSNADEYLKTRRAMDIVGISSEDQVG